MLYSIVATLLRPVFRWARMRVEGRELVPADGPVLIVPNHDSQWDPLAVAVAVIRRRKLRFLARANLWDIPGVRALMKSSRQIPIERGSGDRQPLVHAVEALEAGEAVCVFPEGKLSEGERLRARSGVGFLARDCPEVPVVLVAVEGTTDWCAFRAAARRGDVLPAGRRPAPPGRVALRGGGPSARRDPRARAARPGRPPPPVRLAEAG